MRLAFFIFLVLTVGALGGCQPKDEPRSASTADRPGFARVRATDTIHCGYALWPGGLMKDEKTGAFSGLMADFMNEVGRVANVKIVWDHEVDWGQLRQEFDAGKIDAMCASDWIQAYKIRQVYYSNPFAYDVLVAVVRADDKRFDGNLNALDNKNITAVAIENDASDLLARANYPNARRVYIAPMAQQQDCFEWVHTGKADVTFMDPAATIEYIKNNPGSLKIIPGVKPVAIYALGIPVERGDTDMVQMFNAAITQMQAEGFLDRLIDTYRKTYPNMFYRLSELDSVNR